MLCDRRFANFTRSQPTVNVVMKTACGAGKLEKSLHAVGRDQLEILIVTLNDGRWTMGDGQ